jgi:hypothetical protein
MVTLNRQKFEKFDQWRGRIKQVRVGNIGYLVGIAHVSITVMGTLARKPGDRD